MTKIAFLDLEASGLAAASWPIEVGWCFETGDPETMLIRPAEDWPMSAWDENAEALHGLGVEALKASGTPASEVCERLNQVFDGVTVYSDAPDWDGFWLYRLFSAAGTRQRFSLLDFRDLLSGLTSETVSAAVEKAITTAPHRHRAHDDVLHMKTIFDLATSC